MNMNPKLSAAGIAAAISVLCVWGLEQAGVSVPPEVASAITMVVAVAVGFLRSQGDWTPKV
jgi:hypothetical protein